MAERRVHRVGLFLPYLPPPTSPPSLYPSTPGPLLTTAMSRKTPWTKGPSSLPSDRLPPRSSTPKSSSTKSNSKGKGPQEREEPKSAEVRRLERQIQKLRAASLVDPDPKGGCFCRARTHPLSPYTPICKACGLVLCSINAPQHPCPHCLTPLLDATTRDDLVLRLTADLSHTIAREIEARERAIEEARRAAGSFPTLSGAPPPPSSSSAGGIPPPHPMASHKVLSLTGKNNRVIVSSYTPKPKVTPPSAGQGKDGEEEENVVRTPPPPDEPPYARRKPGPDRPFENMLGGGGIYVPPPLPEPSKEDAKRGGGSGEGGRGGGRRKKGKGKEKEKENAGALSEV
ncbi:hypothetical protein CC1G_08434 [Coprinopsis cinerea okayama7|uniref:TRIP4/RQT4 C2HC5-type zinc finger domain-containing protein n=1 Tax=Coprinopsis cinerea (strain Okayama-7 / 130 / ATCC MYA-4618 / FGSC 9003) TaxID=240176 RepID=A8NAR5_COPC7|nr:hypothetical protein CC1G_08434 [Coprinopsis cinerea okayama7\|eukprot:XP_001831917.2 hypothetical protein CC1G_08434 [Coprinopsis cinerea okayama7\